MSLENFRKGPNQEGGEFEENTEGKFDLDRIKHQLDLLRTLPLSADDIEEALDKYEAAKKGIDFFASKLDERIARVESYSEEVLPLEHFDYSLAEKYGIVGEEEVRALREMEELIREYQKIQDLPSETLLYLQESQRTLDASRDAISRSLEEKIQSRVERIKGELEEHHQERIKRYEAIIDELREKIPDIDDLIEKRRERMRQEEEQKVRESYEKLINEIMPILQSFESKHQKAFEDLSSLVSEKRIEDLKASPLRSKEFFSLIQSIRDTLVTKVLRGEVERGELKSMIPWNRRTAIPYNIANLNRISSSEFKESIDYLKNEEEAEKFKERIREVRKHNAIFSHLFAIPKDRNKLRRILDLPKDEFLRLVYEEQERLERQAQEAKKRVEIEKKMQEMLETPGALEVEFPIYKKTKKGLKITSYQKGVVILGIRESKKSGVPYFVIEETFNFPESDGNKNPKGNTYDSELRFAPMWLVRSFEKKIGENEIHSFIEEIIKKEK